MESETTPIIFNPEDYEKELRSHNGNIEKVFHWAVFDKDFEFAKWLLDHGANINQANNAGRSLFYIATDNGDLIIMQWLFDNGADINKAAYNDTTPFACAASKGNLEVMQWLFDNGADILQVCDNYGKTLFLIAASNGHSKAMQWLLDNGADIHQNSILGETPFHAAAFNGHSKSMQWLLEHEFDINLVNNQGRTPFVVAVDEEAFESIQWLIENRANLPSEEYRSKKISKEMNNKIDAIVEYINEPMLFADTITFFKRSSLVHQQINQFINPSSINHNNLHQTCDNLEKLPDDMLILINSFLGAAELMRFGEYNSKGVFQSIKMPKMMDIAFSLYKDGFKIQYSAQSENTFLYAVSLNLENSNIEEMSNHVIQYMYSNLQDYQALIASCITAILTGGNFPSVASSPQLMQMITDALSLRVDIFIVEANEIHSIIPTGEVTKTIKLLSQNGKYYTIIERKENLIELNVEEEEYGYEESKSSSNDNDHSSSSSSSSSSSNNAGEHDDLNLSDSEVDVDQVYHAQEANQKASSNLVYPTLYILNSLLELFKEFGDRIPETKNFINKMISNYKENYNKYLSKEFTYDVMSKGLIAAFENIDKEISSEEQESTYEYIIDIEHSLKGKTTSDFTNMIVVDHSGPMHNLEQGPGMFDFF